MKKKYRNIIVDGKKYGWLIDFNCDGDGGNYLRIFDKKLVIDFRKINCNISQITPKIVENEIRYYEKIKNLTYEEFQQYVRKIKLDKINEQGL